jgi:hypothetical protein
VWIAKKRIQPGLNRPTLKKEKRRGAINGDATVLWVVEK